jgi:dihydroorotase
MINQLEILRPDDWHVHLRDGALLEATLPATASLFARAIIMPNLVPPIRTMSNLRAYRERILSLLPSDHAFQPLMTLYLTEEMDPKEIRIGAQSGDLTAVKLYPAGATTNSESGVKDVAKVGPVFDEMQACGIPLLVHGEVTDPTVDIFDREAVFIERVLEPLRRQYPGLRVVMEHITTEHAVSYVGAAEANLAATITPHHLLINRNAIFNGGLRPHMFCLPVAKREHHRLALRRAATSGDPRFFLGTDSAPHTVVAKESACGCAGIFNAPVALPCVAQVFDEEGALGRLESFVSRSGAAFYGLPVNADTITLAKRPPEDKEFIEIEPEPGTRIRIFRSDTEVTWSVSAGLRSHDVAANTRRYGH